MLRPTPTHQAAGTQSTSPIRHSLVLNLLLLEVLEPLDLLAVLSLSLLLALLLGLALALAAVVLLAHRALNVTRVGHDGGTAGLLKSGVWVGGEGVRAAAARGSVASTSTEACMVMW